MAGSSPRASQVILFVDYDGVGLNNFATSRGAGRRLRFLADAAVESKLARYGGDPGMAGHLAPLHHRRGAATSARAELTEQMQQLGMALEQRSTYPS